MADASVATCCSLPTSLSPLGDWPSPTPLLFLKKCQSQGSQLLSQYVHRSDHMTCLGPVRAFPGFEMESLSLP